MTSEITITLFAKDGDFKVKSSVPLAAAVRLWRQYTRDKMTVYRMLINGVPAPAEYGFLQDLAKVPAQGT